VQPLLADAGLWRAELDGSARPWLLRVLELLRPRVKRLPQFVDDARPFLDEDVSFDDAAVKKHLNAVGMRAHLEELRRAFEGVPAFDSAALEATLRNTAEARGVKAAALIHATRVAVTGRAVSPGLFEVLELLGSDRVRARLDRAAKMPSE
jgi:glutamyl-tRNA synthetase